MKLYSSIAAIVAIASATVPGTSALCPRGFEIPPGAKGETHASWVRHSRRLEEVPSPPEPTQEYLEAMKGLDIEAVKEDIFLYLVLLERSTLENSPVKISRQKLVL